MEEAPHPCCNPESPSPIWDGTPTGKIITIDGIETYISIPTTPTPPYPTTPPTILLFLTEGHGIYLPNAQLLADSFAAQLEIPVFMPDQFASQARLPRTITPSFPPGSKLIPWIEDTQDVNFENRGLRLPLHENPDGSDAYPFAKPPWWKQSGASEFEAWKGRHEPDVTDPILAKVLQYIYSVYGTNVRVLGIGYCFGGRYILRLMGKGVIDIGVVNHPSFFTMDEISKLGDGKRVAVFAAEKDDILPREKRREMEDLLADRGVTWRCTVFGGVEHGFAVRGDLSVREVKHAKEEAFRSAAEWFRLWM